MKHRPFAARFWDKVQQTPGCWLWLANKDDGGYGLILSAGRGSKVVRAHVASWELQNGSVPAGLFVLHRCDVPACVRPDHLFLGTIQQNVADMVAKGRQARGASIAQSKLTAALVSALRIEHTAGASKKALARKYNITPHAVLLIVRRDTWKHVP